MKRLVIGAGIVAVLVASAVVIVPMVLPKDAIKARVIQEVEAASGLRLRIDGPVSISFCRRFISARKMSGCRVKLAPGVSNLPVPVPFLSNLVGELCLAAPFR
ncbi:hypothetical protein V6L77_09795 [Pannonibacter sp. Pt2-lr]